MAILTSGKYASGQEILLEMNRDISKCPIKGSIHQEDIKIFIKKSA